MKKHLILPIFLSLALVLAVYRPAPAADQPKLPSPPPKVFEDGTPWKAVDQEEAVKRAHEQVEPAGEVVIESPGERKLRLGAKQPGLSDMKHRYMVLDSPLLKNTEEPFNDQYGPVRFMHAKHAAELGDCLTCHHYRPADQKALETVRCSACHREPFNPEILGRPGLKAAYHQQCLNCHRERSKGPVGCVDCHTKNVPDHKDLVVLPDNPAPEQVTLECLRCHEQAGEDMLTAAHWRWQGPSPYTIGREKRVDMGKATNTINNFLRGPFFQLAPLHQLSCRIRLERQHLRPQRQITHGLSGLSRHHHDLFQGAHRCRLSLSSTGLEKDRPKRGISHQEKTAAIVTSPGAAVTRSSTAI